MPVLVESAPHVTFLDVRSKEEAVASLVLQLDVNQRLVGDAVMQREHVISTGIGMGIAIPHAKITGLEEFHVVIGVVQHEGIEWDAIDHLPVKLIILICGPDDRHKEYLALLSSLTKKIKQEEVRQILFSAKNPEEVVKIFASC